MCGGPERLRSSSSPTLQEEKSKKNKNASSSSVAEGMDQLADETDGSLSSLLELAANNDVVALKRSLDRDSSGVDEVDLWYGREEGSNRMDLKRRTPLMVAATYGSLDVLGLLLSLSSSIEVNRVSDGVTALHCAASGGSTKATDAVKLLLSAGADPNSVNATGCRPVDVIVVPPKLPYVRTELEELLGKSNGATADYSNHAHRVITSPSCTESPSLSSSSCADASLSSCSPSPPMSSAKTSELQPNALPEKKEYPVGQSLPDINNSIYASDEFRMYSFKVRPCSRAYSHDWTECPFVHPGENARRRDPRKYPYSCVPCPDFRKGACRRGVSCEYAHGVFECWLHPAQYRTRLCKDGTSCARRVCFFAHTNEELRPLYMSTGSSVSSLMNATAALEMGSTMGLMPGSPMSPSTNGIGHSSLAWPQPNVPVMHLPGSNLPASRLRSSLSARNMPLDDFSGMLGCGDAQQLVNDLCYTRLGSSLPGQFPQPKILVPSNFDDLFSAAISPSPVYDSDQGAISPPSRKAAILNKIQRQQQNLLSPITTAFSPKNMDYRQLHEHSALLQDTLGVPSPGMVSPRSMDAISSMSSHPDLLAQQGNKQLTHQSFSSRHHGSGTSQIVGSPDSSSWSKWASPSRKLDWGVNGEELGQLRGSSSFEMRANSEEPDLSWVHSLERESPHVKVSNASMMVFDPSSLRPTIGVEASISDDQFIGLNQSAGLRAWLEKFQLDQMLTEQGQLHEDRHFIVTNDLSK